VSHASRLQLTLRHATAVTAFLLLGACEASTITEPREPTIGQVIFWTSAPRLIPSAVIVNGWSAGRVTSG
jgi:hypothetical protein